MSGFFFEADRWIVELLTVSADYDVTEWHVFSSQKEAVDFANGRRPMVSKIHRRISHVRYLA